MLYSDMYHQYYPFFVAFRRAIRSGSGLLYTWSVGMGMDYLGLISYYLASPLNLLSVLVPEGWLLEFFSLLVPVKLGFAGMFFAIFLKKLFGKNDASHCGIRGLLRAVRLGAGVSVERDVAGHLRPAAPGGAWDGVPAEGEKVLPLHGDAVPVRLFQLLYRILYLYFRFPAVFCV